MTPEYSRRMGRLLNGETRFDTPFIERIWASDKFNDLSRPDQKMVLEAEKRTRETEQEFKKYREKLERSAQKMGLTVDEYQESRLHLYKGIVSKPPGTELLYQSGELLFWAIGDGDSDEKTLDDEIMVIMTDVSSGGQTEPKPLWVHLKWVQGNISKVEEPVGVGLEELAEEAKLWEKIKGIKESFGTIK